MAYFAPLRLAGNDREMTLMFSSGATPACRSDIFALPPKKRIILQIIPDVFIAPYLTAKFLKVARNFLRE